MACEIERKFLVVGEAWRALGTPVLYRQGYLNRAKERTVRVRVAGAQATLTIKGLTTGATRAEYEYAIPLADAQVMLDTLAERPLIEKRRTCIPHAGVVIEVDEFFGDNLGLIIAEVELASEAQVFDHPAWLGAEVTHDPRYYNANLVQCPYRTW